jgi:uncharacterized protein (TIGR03437 family)
MALAVCQFATSRRLWAVFALVLAGGVAQAQTQVQRPLQPDWRKVGPSSAELMLASPATGPVEQVWFSPQGAALYARTHAGIFWTADFEAWSPAPEGSTAPIVFPAIASRLPEAGAQVISASAGAAIFALGRNLYKSDDAGRSWTNLTAWRSQSVIGSGQRSVAVSPVDPNQLVVSNDFGVWRTMDGGATWSGLNLSLPNLPVRRILSTPSGVAGTRIQVDNWPQAMELPPGGSLWVPGKSADLQVDEIRKESLSAALGATITAVAVTGETLYAGANDGRLWYSTDGGATFQLSSPPPGVLGSVERIFVDASQPRVALAALSGAGPHILRTFNGGGFWDAMDADLPNAPAHSVTADVSSGAVYAATSAGVFWTQVDLLSAGSPQHWTSLTAGLPAAPAYDVRLDPSAVQLYIALDGYGVYAAPAPHRRLNLRVVNAFDFSTRPAAPGSLLSVVGAQVNSARAGGIDYPVLGEPSDAESQIQVPFQASGPAVSLALDTATGLIHVDLQVQPVSPAIFVAQDGAPMLYDADSGLPLDARNPARSGGRVQIFATGLGQVQPPWPAGVPTPLEGEPHAVAAQVKATLDGVSVPVIRAGLAPGYIGFYLVEVQLPSVVNFGGAELQLTADGHESNPVQILIEP